ncbi:MAG TPA: hypothetical protein PL182_07230 [Pseudobdellovibrionaceae bacterium]|nr:hypothetical protein [Pseudobdellovibrionaceae bacterium]
MGAGFFAFGAVFLAAFFGAAFFALGAAFFVAFLEAAFLVAFLAVFFVAFFVAAFFAGLLAAFLAVVFLAAFFVVFLAFLALAMALLLQGKHCENQISLTEKKGSGQRVFIDVAETGQEQGAR